MDLFDKMLEESPVALEEYMTLPEIGGVIKVYEGEFFLKKKEHSFSITGRVYYSFAEKIRLLFKGVFERFDSDLVGQEVEIIAGEYLLGYAFVQKVSGSIISGYVNHLETDSSAPCERWRWCYFNGLKFFGESVRRNRSISKDRLVFKAGPYIITIDNMEDKGMEEERAKNFQRMIVKRLVEVGNPDYQLIFATSNIAEELDDPRYTVGEYYTSENKSLKNV